MDIRKYVNAIIQIKAMNTQIKCDVDNLQHATSLMGHALSQLLGAFDAELHKQTHHHCVINPRTKVKLMPRILKHGQGSISKRIRTNKNGTIYRYYQGRYTIDNAVHTVLGATYTQCYNKLACIRKEPQQSLQQSTTVMQWYNTWIDTYKKAFVSTKTMTVYNSCLKHIPQNLLQQDITTVKAQQLQLLLNDVASTMSNTAMKLYNMLSQMFEQAFNNDILSKNIAKAIIKPKHEYKEESTLLSNQQDFILENSTGWLKRVIEGYILTGCRVSELLTLKWEYYNEKDKTLYINGTKNKHSKRTIPVLPRLEKLLQNIPKETESIFNVSQKTINREKTRFSEQYNIHFTLKSLRHTFNQNLAEANIPDIIRAKWLGHSKPATTNKVYTHATKKLEQDAIITLQNETEKQR